MGSNTPVAPVIRATIDTLATYLAKNLPANARAIDVYNLLNNYLNLNANVVIPLSSLSVDYEVNKAEITSVLAKNNSWKDTITAATGQTIIEMIATALTYAQYATVRSAQETMIDTAVLQNSIYAATRHLGQRISRKIPASCPVTLSVATNINGIQIPAYSSFSIANGYYFNRNAINIPAGTTSLDTVLYEGKVSVINQFSTGTTFQKYIIGNNNFAISDVDVVVSINNTNWSRTTFNTYFNIGLWEYNSNDTVFSDFTTADGNVEINFGNGINGLIPSTNAAITITYAQTNGAEANVNLTNSTISSNSFPGLSGIVTGKNSGGSDPLTASSYKFLGPALYAAKYRAVDRQGHAAIAIKYPGVIDAIFLGQQDFAPSDLRYMMVMQVCLLTNTVWTNQDFNNFLAYMYNTTIANMTIIPVTASPVTLNITADVYCTNTAKLPLVQGNIISNIANNYKPQVGTLGYSTYISDITDIILNTDRTTIDYLDLNLPTADVIMPNKYSYIVLGTVIINMRYTVRSNPGPNLK